MQRSLQFPSQIIVFIGEKTVQTLTKFGFYNFVANGRIMKASSEHLTMKAIDESRVLRFCCGGTFDVLRKLLISCGKPSLAIEEVWVLRSSSSSLSLSLSFPLALIVSLSLSLSLSPLSLCPRSLSVPSRSLSFSISISISISVYLYLYLYLYLCLYLYLYLNRGLIGTAGDYQGEYTVCI